MGTSAKASGPQGDETDVPLKLTLAQYRALQATVRGEVHRTRDGITYSLTGPGGSKALWALERAGLIAEPPEAAGQSGRHRMVITTKGLAALDLASSTFAVKCTTPL